LENEIENGSGKINTENTKTKDNRSSKIIKTNFKKITDRREISKRIKLKKKILKSHQI